MDSAYDHIQESALSPDSTDAQRAEASTLNSDFQEAYRAISSSPWGAKLGGFFGSVVKQGEHVYKEASNELSAVGLEATKGLTDLRSSIVSRTRSLSLAQRDAGEASSGAAGEAVKAGEESLQEEGVLARLRTEAARRLKEIEKAEDAADEALLRFGTSIRGFLADAVRVAPPVEGASPDAVLFESKDAQGKRVIHTTRFEAQLHVIHVNLEGFTKDPSESEEWTAWKAGFDVEERTGEISGDLKKYAELRAAMEKLVPDQVAYKDFWTRYYFLRHSIETAEARRRDLLKGATADAEEEVGWDEDSDDEDASKTAPAAKDKTSSAASSQTINPPPIVTLDEARLAPLDAKVRKPSADDRSLADSEASYDVIGDRSGISSQAPESPRLAEAKKSGDDSDEDWE